MTTFRKRGLRALTVTATALALSVPLAPTASAHDYTVVHHGYAPPNTTLTTGTPESVGLRSEPIEAARALIRSAQQVAPGAAYPLLPGAVGVMGHDGVIVASEVSGHARLWADDKTKLPESERIAMRSDTIFDLASVSKLFTSLVAVQLVEEGRLSLDAPVSTYLPEFANNGKQDITVSMLLTHTTALPAWLPLYSAYPDIPSRVTAVMNSKPTQAPGTIYRYSDLNLITLGLIVEELRGAPLDQVVRERITDPLGMTDTGFNPLSWGDAGIRERIAATEWQGSIGRGMVWGEVHDENAWSFAGVAGHAGVFSTAHDLSILSQALLNGGSYAGNRILTKKGVDLLITNFNEEFKGNDHGLGFELNQRWYMAGLSAPDTAGHTGYTGTSLVIDFDSRSFAILLTNRVHPVRTAGAINAPRRDWAQGLALAMPVRPTAGDSAWFTGVKDATTSTLTVDVNATAAAKLSFDVFLDTEETDALFLEVTRDGGQTWQPLPVTLQDRGRPALLEDGRMSASGLRRHVKATATLAAGDQQVRWRSVTDALYVGRGVYVDAIKVTGAGASVDAEQDPSVVKADGWVAVDH